MAKAKNKLSESQATMLAKLRGALGDLCDRNIERIEASAGVEDAAKFAIAVKINKIDTAPQVIAKIRWSKRFSDSIEFSLEDASQTELFKDGDEKDDA